MHRNQHNYDKMKLEIQKILLAFALPLLLLFILYTLRTMESVMNWDFITWGIYPKETKGIMGILTSPLIHADWGHLFANTFPLLFLLWCLLYFYRDLGIGILFFIWIVSGILTFIIGKPGWHIGASSIIYSLAFFLFFSGILRKHVPLVALSLLVTFLYGSLVWNMFPQFASSTTSWEGHLGGAAAGIAAAILFRHKGPQQPELFIDEEEEDNRSYPEDEEVSVSLLEGKVCLRNYLKNDALCYLEPDQKAILNKKNGKLMVSASEARYTAEWTNGFLFFDEELLPDIIKELERSYNVKIHIEDESLKTFRFYGNFVRKEQTIQEILEMLASTGKLEYRIEGKTVRLSSR